MGWFWGDDERSKPSGTNRKETWRQQSNGSWQSDFDANEWDCNRWFKVLVVIGGAGLLAILGAVGLGAWWVFSTLI